MSGVAGRSGRKMFVPTPEQRNTVRVLVALGIPQKQICRLVVNRQTQKPLDHKTLRKHLAHEIAIGTVELHALIGKFMVATILGTPPPAGTVAIKDDRARGQLMMFLLKTKFGWKETWWTAPRSTSAVRSKIRIWRKRCRNSQIRSTGSGNVSTLERRANLPRAAREKIISLQPRTRHRRMA